MNKLDEISWPLIIVLCSTLGLAPYYPVPHLVEKISMLFTGNLKRPLDIFDLFLHGFPFVILFTKSIRTIQTRGKGIK